MLKHGFEFSHRADPFAARELVDLRRYHRASIDGLSEPPPRRHIALEPRMASVDEQQCREVWRVEWAWQVGQELYVFPYPTYPTDLTIPLEVRGDQRFELHRRVAAAPRVPVARKVHQIKRRTAGTHHAVDVCEPRFPRRRARACHAPADERVDEARFANIGAPDERNLGKAVVRQIARARGTTNENGVDRHG